MDDIPGLMDVRASSPLRDWSRLSSESPLWVKSCSSLLPSAVLFVPDRLITSTNLGTLGKYLPGPCYCCSSRKNLMSSIAVLSGCSDMKKCPASSILTNRTSLVLAGSDARSHS